MTEPKIVYVVTQGRWSDYHIEGIFTTRELAEAFIGVLREESYRQVEEWPLNGPTDVLREYLWPFFVIMDRDGSVDRVWKYTDFSYGYSDTEVPPRFDPKGLMEVTVLARDETHAIKIANEKRTQLIALNQWEAPK